MLDDNSCVSEVTSAISRIRMQSNTVNKTLSSSDDINSALQSPNIPVIESPDNPVTNAFRLRDIIHSGATSLNTSRYNIPIIGYEIMEERARFTVYKLRIENSVTGDCWFVFRRYTDFVRLFSKLKTDFPSVKLTLPRKRWFGDNFDPNFLEDRIHGLQCFVNAILEHQDLYTAPSVQDFFCLNEPPAYAESVEESRAIFEALEETIYHLRSQLKEKDMELNRLRASLTAEIKKKDRLSQILRDSTTDCPQCGKDFTAISSPLSDTSILKEIISEENNGISSQKHTKAQL
ncbi:sorting nexin-16 [Zootermopsis nevadensis]|uniref:Sorting nexin-16 n=1 Tax=Zootermopsis nevadensis TaxID=136037 RepID=A0A067RE38_ZOONE|nr:sorting nexin-16 [Zootermopsis nevadensis]KDR18303.1 Sorting nexin-16 [Zootermopsis nevadensis]